MQTNLKEKKETLKKEFLGLEKQFLREKYCPNCGGKTSHGRYDMDRKCNFNKCGKCEWKSYEKTRVVEKCKKGDGYLHDVLLWAEKKGLPCFYENGEIEIRGKDDKYIAIPRDLEKDLTGQSEVTINPLYSLVCSDE